MGSTGKGWAKDGEGGRDGERERKKSERQEDITLGVEESKEEETGGTKTEWPGTKTGAKDKKEPKGPARLRIIICRPASTGKGGRRDPLPRFAGGCLCRATPGLFYLLSLLEPRVRFLILMVLMQRLCIAVRPISTFCLQDDGLQPRSRALRGQPYRLVWRPSQLAQGSSSCRQLQTTSKPDRLLMTRCG